MRKIHTSGIVALLLCAVLFSACTGGSSKAAPVRALYTGSDGIIVTFPQTNAVRQYEKDLFTVSVRLYNDGTADLTKTAPGILSATYDSSVIKAKEIRSSSTDFTSVATEIQLNSNNPGNIAPGMSILNQLAGGPPGGTGTPTTGFAQAPFTARGRSRDMTVGDIAFVEYTFEAASLLENRQQASTPLTVQACYPYTTTFIADVCVDRDLLNGGSGGGCAASTLTAQPQGAPISVRTVTPRYTRVDGGVQARYEITLENLRDGIVLWPGENADVVRTCDLSQLSSEAYGKVFVTAQITGTPLRCGSDDTKPGIARFDKKQANIICRLDPRDLPAGFQNGANYQAPLIIQARYFYIQSLTAKIDVVRQ